MGVLAVAGCGDKSTDPLVSIAIGPAPLDVVDAGSTVQLTATGTNRDGTTNDITATVAWSSSNELVASVDGSGVLSPHQPGTVTITAASKSLTTTHAVCVQGIARLEIGTPMDAPAGYLDNPVAVTAGSGQVLVAYGINDGTVWPPVRSLVTRRSSASSLPSWTLEDTGIQDSWQTSAPDVQLAANTAGVAGMVYRRTADDLNADSFSFGVAYFDGTAWTWNATVRGTIAFQLGMKDEDGARSPVVAVDAEGALFVAYRGATATYALDELSVARFAPDGTATLTTWPEHVGQIYVSANATGQVMVLNAATGSRLFDGATWGDLEPFQPAVGGDVGARNAQLNLDDDGTATLLGFDGGLGFQVFHRDASGWSAGAKVQLSTNPDDWAAASSGDGRTVVAFTFPGLPSQAGHISVWVLDGSVSGGEVVLDGGVGGTFPTSVRNPSVVYDGGGRFVVLYQIGYATMRASWFDGTWHPASELVPAGVFVPAVAMGSDGQFIVVNDFGVYDSLQSATFALRP